MQKIEKIKLEKFDNNIAIYQRSDLYKFTQDAILLAKFCNIKHTDNVLELCAGSGVISFYAYSLSSFNNLYFNEIQPKMCDILNENIKYNKLEAKSKLFNCNLKDLKVSDFCKPIDVIICNPPYSKLSPTSKINDRYEIAIARHELEATLEDIIKKSSEILKDKGRLYMVHLASRTTEIAYLAHMYNMEVKNFKFIFNDNKNAYLVLAEIVKGAKPSVTISKN